MRRNLVVGFAANALIGCVAAQTADSDVLRSNICELTSGGAKYHGRQVTLQAQYSTDLMHFTNLTDRACPHVLVDADKAENSQADESVRAFNTALYAIPIGQPHDFLVEVVGEFRWDPNWEPPALLSAVVKPQPHGTLYIQKIVRFQRVNEGVKLPSPTGR